MQCKMGGGDRQFDFNCKFLSCKKKKQLIKKDRSASVLVTVSVCRSKTLIEAAISPHCTSAACQMEMEGI